MSDLATRLRATSYSLPSEGEWVEVDGDTMPNNVCTQAADRITTLENTLRQADDRFQAIESIAKQILKSWDSGRRILPAHIHELRLIVDPNGTEVLKLSPPRVPRVGDVYERLTVESFNRTAGGRRYWNCVCECGTKVVVATGALNNGNTRSCGCLYRDRANEYAKTHGMKKTPEYRSWCGIIQRCTNPNNKNWHQYGGRGITMCDRWRNSFEDFMADMGPCPAGFQIDRIDNDGNYEPSNCKWSSRAEQTRNRRVTLMWEGKAIAAIAEETGISYGTLFSRFKKYGTPFPAHMESNLKALAEINLNSNRVAP